MIARASPTAAFLGHNALVQKIFGRWRVSGSQGMRATTSSVIVSGGADLMNVEL
jgi:hypothetical protein